MIETIKQALAQMHTPVLETVGIPRDTVPVIALRPAGEVIRHRAGSLDYIRELSVDLVACAATPAEATTLTRKAEQILCARPYKMKMTERVPSFDPRGRVYMVSSRYKAYELAGRQAMISDYGL